MNLASATKQATPLSSCSRGQRKKAVAQRFFKRAIERNGANEFAR